MKYLSNISIGNVFFRKKYKDDDLSYFRQTFDIDPDPEMALELTRLAQEHFLSDKRFNLPDQKVFNISVSFYRYNDKEWTHYINYSVDLGLYGYPSYKGNMYGISQSFKAPDHIVTWFEKNNGCPDIRI